MKEFRELSPEDKVLEPIRIIGKEWMLIGAKKPTGEMNAMTASWEESGCCSTNRGSFALSALSGILTNFCRQVAMPPVLFCRKATARP